MYRNALLVLMYRCGQIRIQGCRGLLSTGWKQKSKKHLKLIKKSDRADAIRRFYFAQITWLTHGRFVTGVTKPAFSKGNAG